MKLGLYSITYLGLWYRGEALPLPEMIARAKKYGYDGIEIDGKRPHGNPLDWPAPRCRELRSIADGEGIDIFAVAANNDFSNPVPEVREAQICFVRDLIRMTADLGAPTLRVFLAWWGVTRHPQLATYDIAERLWPIVHEKFSTEEIWGWCREALVECARYAGDAGVTLALQNHKPLIKDHHDVLRMVEEVGSPHLKVCLDAPLMPDRSTAAIEQAARDGRPAPGPLALRRRIRAAGRRVDPRLRRHRRSRRRGHEPVLPRLRPRDERDRLRRLHRLRALPPVARRSTARPSASSYADQNAQLAAEFMRDLIEIGLSAGNRRRRPMSLPRHRLR